MNYEELESLLSEVIVEMNKSNYTEVERICRLVLDKLPLISTIDSTKSKTLSISESSEEWNKIASLRAKALNGLSKSIWRRGMFKEAIPPAEEAQLLSFQFGNKQEEASAIINLGTINNYLSDYSNSLNYFQKALEIYKEIGNINGVASNLGNIGLIYCNLSDYSKALDYQQKALEIHKEVGIKLYIAADYGNIGITYHKLTDINKALDYFQKALEINKEIENKNGIVINLGSIGNAYFKLQEYTKSLDYYKKALELNEEFGEKNGVAINLGNIGIVYQNLSDYSTAIYYLKKALEINTEMGNKFGIAGDLMASGVVYATKEYDGYDAKKAEDYMFMAISLCEEINNKEILPECHLNLAKLYEENERWEESHKHYKKYHELEKEILSEDAKKQGEMMEYRRKIEESERDRQVKLARFQEQEKILLNILPAEIAERILVGEKQIADLHEHVSVFFSDIVGFTQLSQKVTPDELLSMLNEIFSEFDRIARKHGLEKIKTIGDAYMAVAGVPLAQEDHAERAAAFAMEVIEYMKAYRKSSNSDLQIRVGLHCGKAIAGVIGENKFAYDLWGDSVNTASRMESHGEAGRIHVSDDFKNALNKSSFHFTERGEMEVKGKGKMKTYFLEKTN